MFTRQDYKFINYDYYYNPANKSIKLNEHSNTSRFFFGVSNQYKLNFPEFKNPSEYYENKYFKIEAHQANENYLSVNLRTAMFYGFNDGQNPKIGGSSNVRIDKGAPKDRVVSATLNPKEHTKRRFNRYAKKSGESEELDKQETRELLKDSEQDYNDEAVSLFIKALDKNNDTKI